MKLSAVEEYSFAMYEEGVFVPGYLPLSDQGLLRHKDQLRVTISCKGALLYGLMRSLRLGFLIARASAEIARPAKTAAFNSLLPSMFGSTVE